ncbi:MAG: SRPBCC domain-containing protein [Phycisphaerae bacterium]|nr:SRPBCC domain-containing protein [Phycisphaerae bacterium]
MSSSNRAFEMKVEIDASAEDVWKALTDAKELARWFPLEAQVKPGLNGSIFLSWGPNCQGTGEITAWDPPRHFQWTEPSHHFEWTESLPPGEGGKVVPVCVNFYVEGRGGQTSVRLVHSGIGASEKWDAYLDSITRGWKFELRGLRHYLEHHRGKDRDVIWIQRRVRGEASEIAAKVIGPQGGILRGEVSGLGEGDRYRLSAPDDASIVFEGEVRVNGLPRSFCATVENLNNAYLRFEVEGGGDENEVWLWLSTYGVDAATRSAIERAWRSRIEELMPEE